MSYVKQVVEHLQTTGICVIEDYYSKTDCEKCVSDIDRCMIEFEDKIQRHAEINEGNDGDERLFKIENQSNLALKLSQDDFIHEVAKHFYDGFDCETVQVLGQRLVFDSKYTRGSGGGWHVDSKNIKQLKALVYLTDVTEDNGAYMFLPNSHHLNLELRDDPRNRITRFTDEGVKNCGIEPFVVTGKKGTIILTNTSNIHRGSIIKKGERYSLTSYIHRSDKEVIDSMQRKWGEWYVPKK